MRIHFRTMQMHPYWWIAFTLTQCQCGFFYFRAKIVKISFKRKQFFIQLRRELVSVVSGRKISYGLKLSSVIPFLYGLLQQKIYWPGFPLNLENLENLEKWEYTWKTWKYHGIWKNLINIMEKWQESWKNLVATKNSPLTPLKQYKIH